MKTIKAARFFIILSLVCAIVTFCLGLFFGNLFPEDIRELITKLLFIAGLYGIGISIFSLISLNSPTKGFITASAIFLLPAFPPISIIAAIVMFCINEEYLS